MKSARRKLYYSISEAAEQVEETPGMLRYWEQNLPHLVPSKSRGGTRKYTTSDIKAILEVKYFYRTKGMKLSAIKRIMNEKGEVQVGEEVEQTELLHTLYDLKVFLQALRNQI